MRFRLIVGGLVSVLVLAISVAACGDDGGGDDDSDDSVASPAPTEMVEEAEPTEPVENGDVPSGPGTASLTIGDETWTFIGYYCAFSPEETGNDRVSFSSGAFGQSTAGARMQFDASIQDTEEQGSYEGPSTIQSVTLIDLDNFENPSLDWEAVSGIVGDADFQISVDGKSVRAEAAFDDGTTDEIEAVPGTVEGTCP